MNSGPLQELAGGSGCRWIAVALAAFLIGAAPVSAQISADEGVFVIHLDGREAGTESFSIQRRGSGENLTVIAQGRITLARPGGQQVITSSLRATGAALRPSTYQVTVTGVDNQRITGALVGGRFSARIFSPAGETMREYLAGEGAILIDQDVAHHFAFLWPHLAAAPLRLPMIVPRQNRQITTRVTVDGSDVVRIGGADVSATRISLESERGQAGQVWLDAGGRVLRVEVPALGYSAVRSAVPR